MKKAFTLIELLIVVAIIAILAAIAVPNFLEAQVRSKVSRVKSDMRSLATAIESYAVDHGKHPWGLWSHRTILGPSAANYASQHLEQVTTPVAYITTLPSDPFTEKGVIGNDGSQVVIERLTYRYNTSSPMGSADGSFNNSLFKNAFYWMHSNGITWYLESIGPMRDWTSPVMVTLTGNTEDPDAVLYDSTNGTISDGSIVRYNGGQFDTMLEDPGPLPASPDAWGPGGE